MFAGHFGVAAAVKAKTPEVPLWALMLSTQLLDVVFVPLLIAGIESLEPVDGGGYGAVIIHAHYTHSFISALIMSIIAGLIAWRIWGKRGGIAISSVVFSHWLLDLIVHRADMAILPGAAGNFPLLGLGLWTFPMIIIVFELALIIFGSILYHRSLVPKAKGKQRKHAIAASGLMAVLLTLSLVTSVLGG
ncbi:permease [uncultured Metabacillus sp.]|uniref:permease n=1 Tax=uncultured Metabacillus sp. TaxID=2860135 RepID=UPI002602804A|nr:permease [uncultured Metabacillus sp.]